LIESTGNADDADLRLLRREGCGDGE